MLPTTGHFKDIECPYFEDGCDRPYCHFRHKRKNAESAEQIATQEEVKSEVPTYRPTPKSQLSTRNHIPISYVPDLAVPSTRRFAIDRQITYKPTPISVLTTNKAGSSSSIENILDELNGENETNRNHSASEYNPEISLQNDNFNFEALTTEFDMIDDIISDCDKQISSPELAEKRDSSPELNEKEVSSSQAIDNKRSPSPEPVEKHSKKKDEESSKSSSSKTKHSKKESKRESKSDSKSKESDHRKHDKKKKSSSSRHEHKSSRHKHDKHESKKDKKSDRHSRHKDKDKDRDRSKDKKPEKKEKEKSPKLSPQQDEEFEDSFAEAIDYDDDDDDDYEDDNTMAECYRIFNEYKPEQVAVAKEEIKEPVEVKDKEESEDSTIGKKRVAHEKADNIIPKQYTKQKEIVSAAQMMTNRFKLARLAQASNEQKNILEEIKKQATKRPSNLPAISMQNKIQKLQSNTKKPVILNSTSVVDDILSSSTKPIKTYSIFSIQSKTAPRKIAPVQNVNLLQRAKAKIDEIAKQNAINTLNKTVGQTVAKGNKRIAHVPEFSLSDIPDVFNADKSKLPVNVRTRYLTMLADECFKLYLTKEDAYQRALNEEFKCYERCKALATYRNSAMLSVNRIRKEIQEREKLSLGPISSDETINETKTSEFKGKHFYDIIAGYVLSEDDLNLHGYPRESSIPGRAQIQQTQKQSARVNLEDNERICARCSKIYLVDRKGFPLREEECIYHPLKKRTLRGERTYLCCKSTDDVGCITSNTHVCDAPADIELEGFQTTMQPESENDPRSYAVYALDCEMCYTTKGLELTRVTIVDTELKTVYESLVKPLNPIIDYNTRFSGITKEQMDRTSTSILQVQANILHLCNSKTILIGHSLESDMKALKIIHNTIIDTAVLFPHKFGLPHKRALKALASEYLKKIIQNDIAGHDSAEDALTCMELILWKVKEEQKIRGTK